MSTIKSYFVPIRGWHVLVLILCFFGVTIGVNATFVTLALRTHPGEDVARSYYQGLNYNETLDRRRAQAELGWSASFNVIGSELLLDVRDRAGEPVRGLDLAGLMLHPTDTGRDCEIGFAERADGIYAAALPCSAPGQWRVRAANRGEAPFEMERDLWLR